MKKLTMKLLAVLALSTIIGCKGPQGDQGQRGPGTVTNLSGVVNSNNFFVVNPALTANSNVFVSIGDGLAYIELPYFLPSQGINTYYLLGTGNITIYNAMAAGATSYKITIVSAAPTYFGSKLLE